MNKVSMKILVLDDEVFMLKLLAHVLASLGFTSVKACDNGPEALAWINEPGNRPDLILLDLNMPGMDGVEFVRRLVEHQYAGSLILVSGEDERMLHMAEKLIQAHRIRVLGHAHKPFSRDSLAALLERALETRRSRPDRKSYAAEELASALERSELVNHYQPKVQVATGAVIGVETLVRWQHPIDGLVFPDQFIGVAEEHGMIDKLTRFVVREALAQARAWRQKGLNLRMAVNVSMDNLSSLQFAEFIANEASCAEIAPQDLILEVTESRLMLDQRAPLEVLTRLRMQRFGLAIDDFGTGHSSLRQLRDIPFDELKIDQSFVHDAWRDPTARAIYDASLALGQQLNMVVVAEGVETREDWNLVRHTKCELAQGYFIAKPMPAASIPDWIVLWQERVIQAELA